MCEFLWNHKLDNEEKQENECLALLRNDTLLCKNLVHLHCIILYHIM